MPMMIDKFNAKEEKKGLFMLKKMYDKTKLDGSFQRWGGVKYGSGWTTNQARVYISNYLSGRTFNKIINVNVKESLKYCKELGDQKSIDYFKNVIDEGYDYVSIDGNNSSSFLSSFISGNEELTVKNCDYSDEEINFKELKEDVRHDILYSEKIEVVTLRNITIDEMCNLFRDLNTQTRLNKQEHRQARITPLAQDIRNYGNLTKDFFLKFCFKGDRHIHQRVHEEMLAQLCLKVERDYGTELNGLELDKFYKKAPGELSSSTKNCLNSMIKNANGLYKALKDKGNIKRLSKGKIHNLFEIFKIVCYDNSFKINNYELFFSWFLEEDLKFTNMSKSVQEEDLEDRSYTYWTKFFSNHKFYRKIKQNFLAVFFKDVEKLQQQGIISYVRSTKDYFTWEQKLDLFHRQEGKLRTGENMDVLELYLGKYEADHVTSVKDGGATTIDNAELMTMTQNRQKGSNSNQPYFEFQK
jgi:hypothetical protein